jgi:Lipopolysaccharide-assembly
MNRFSPTLFLTLLLGSAALGENDVKPVPGGEAVELLKILKETQSRDTFLLTLDTLVKLEPKRDGLLPTVIRRADKLGLLKGMASGKLTAEQEALAIAMTKIVEARNRKGLNATAAISRAEIAQSSNWEKAEQAERDGDYALAEKLYTKCYKELRQNADRKKLLDCYNRIVKCQDRNESGAIGNSRDAKAKTKADSSSKLKNKKLDVKTVYIPIFNNKTFQTTPYRGMEFELTRAVIREVELKGYKIISDPNRADTELLGTLVILHKNSGIRTQNNEVPEGAHKLAVAIVWRDLRSGVVLSNPQKKPADDLPPFDRDNLARPDSLEKPEPVMVTGTGSYLPDVGETNAAAQTRVCNKLAKQIAEMMEKDWRPKP